MVSGSGVEAAAEVDLAEGVEVAPAFDQGIDVLVVDVEILGLDEGVLVASAVLSGWMW